MPLDRDHITADARVMLPTYATMFTLLGLLFLFQPARRMAAPAFDPAKALMGWAPFTTPMHAWAAVFLVVAVLEVVALLVHNRKLYVVGLLVGVALVAFWAVVLLVAGIQSPDVSFTSVVWVGGWIAAHFASVRSLRAGAR